jgi:prepilin-type N-terminal cleavage/methylation domain-containing protein
MSQKGMSLIEILVVVTIFAILGILTTQAVFLTLQGSKKSESTVRVRENLDYAVGVMERHLRNANSIISCSMGVINYTDQNGSAGSFSCIDNYVASGSARLTSDTVSIESCSFTCTTGVSTNPPLVNISLEAQDANIIGIQNTTVSTSTQIYLRSY